MYLNRSANDLPGEDVNMSGHCEVPFTLVIAKLLQRCFPGQVFRWDRAPVSPKRAPAIGRHYRTVADTPASTSRRRARLKVFHQRPPRASRSEERRVGKECRSRGSPEH